MLTPPRHPRATTIAAVIMSAAFAGCYGYDALEGRIANHTEEELEYHIAVLRESSDGEREVWNKTVNVGALGTSYLGRITTREGNYTVRARVDTETIASEPQVFDHQAGPSYFMINTHRNSTTIQFMYD